MLDPVEVLVDLIKQKGEKLMCIFLRALSKDFVKLPHGLDESLRPDDQVIVQRWLTLP